MTRSPKWLWLFPLVAAMIAAVSSFEPVLMRAELATVDLRFRVRGARATNANIVLVTIDDATEQAWKDRPSVFWGDSFSKILNRCVDGKAHSIAVDFLFPRDFDRYLAKLSPDRAPTPTFSLLQSIADHKGRLWIARRKETLPFDGAEAPPEFYRDAVEPYLGVVDLPRSPDGVVRSMYRYIGIGTTQVRSLAQAVARPGTTAQIHEDPEFHVNYTGREFRSISAIQLLNAKSPPAELNGAIVVLCATFRGAGDIHDTPIKTSVPGGAVLADGISTLLDNRPIRSLNPWLSALWVAVVGALAAVAALRLPVGPMIGALALGAGLYTVSAFALFAQDIQVPVAGAIWAVVVGAFLGSAAQAYGHFEERRSVERIMGVMVSDSVKTEILRVGGAVSSRRTEAAVMFLDVRNFTSWSEARAPEEVVSSINSLLDRLVPIVDRNGGYVNAFLGDGFLAVFGPPATLDNPAESAMAAAEQIVLEVGRIGSSDRDGGDPWRVGVGLHFGPVILGSVGTAERHQFTVMGNTVNITQRLEGKSKDLNCAIVVSDAVVSRLLTSRPMAGPTDLELRGLSKPVTSYAYTPNEPQS